MEAVGAFPVGVEREDTVGVLPAEADAPPVALPLPLPPPPPPPPAPPDCVGEALETNDEVEAPVGEEVGVPVFPPPPGVKVGRGGVPVAVAAAMNPEGVRVVEGEGEGEGWSEGEVAPDPLEEEEASGVRVSPKDAVGGAPVELPPKGCVAVGVKVPPPMPPTPPSPSPPPPLVGVGKAEGVAPPTPENVPVGVEEDG
jgi:hypothetical protein